MILRNAVSDIRICVHCQKEKRTGGCVYIVRHRRSHICKFRKRQITEHILGCIGILRYPYEYLL